MGLKNRIKRELKKFFVTVCCLLSLLFLFLLIKSIGKGGLFEVNLKKWFSENKVYISLVIAILFIGLIALGYDIQNQGEKQFNPSDIVIDLKDWSYGVYSDVLSFLVGSDLVNPSPGEGNDSFSTDDTITFNATIQAEKQHIANLTNVVGYWAMEGDADDYSEQGNDGTNVNATYNTTGYNGGAFDFERGESGYINCGDISSGTFDGVNEELTILAWIKPKDILSGNYIISKHSGVTTWNQTFFFDISTGKIRFGAQKPAATGNYIQNQTGVVITANEWQQVAVSVDLNDSGTSDRKILLYLNAELQSATTSSGGTPPSYFYDSPNEVIIGANNYDALASFFNGTIDEVIIYNRSLSASEIYDEYSRSSGFFLHNASLIFDSSIVNTTDVSGYEDEAKMSYKHDTVGTYNWAIRANFNDSLYYNNKTDMVLQMPLDQSVHDFSGYQIHTVNVGTIYTSFGKIGGAYEFDGINDYLNSTTTNPYTQAQFANGVTMMAWVNKKGDGDKLDMTPVNLEGRIRLIQNFSNCSQDWGFEMFTGTSQIACSNQPAAENEWVHLAGVWNTTHLHLYINGIHQDNITASGIGTIDGVTRNLGIGAYSYPGGFGTPFNGSIDQVYIWNRSLSSTEISNIYNLEKNSYWQSPNRSIVIQAPEGIIIDFISQDPTDIDTFNLFSEDINITYNISTANVDTDSVKIYYKTNNTNSDITYFVNGTAYTGFFSMNKSRTNSSTMWSFVLDENHIYTGSYNYDELYMEQTAHLDYDLDSVNEYMVVETHNISNITEYIYFGVYADNQTANSNPLSIYACNESDPSSPDSNSNCGNVFNFLAEYTYNHSHTNDSHLVGSAFLNRTTNTIAGVFLTNPFYWAVQGTPGANGWNLKYIVNVSRANACRYTTNNGVSYDPLSGTVDFHVHWGNDTDTFWRYACANHTNGRTNCSSIGFDLIGLAGIPPSAPIVYSPTATSYTGFVPINYTEPSSQYPISFYNISLLNSSYVFNITIISNNSLNLNFSWNSTSVMDGEYITQVEVCDNMSQCSFGFSANFTTNNAPYTPSPMYNITTVYNLTHIECNVTPTDPTGDIMDVYMNVSVNDVFIFNTMFADVSNGTTQIIVINYNNYSKNDNISCWVRLKDFNGWSNLNTTNITVSNTVPVWTEPIPDNSTNEDSGWNYFDTALNETGTGYCGDDDTSDSLSFSIAQENVSEVNCEIVGISQLDYRLRINWSGITSCTVSCTDSTDAVNDTFNITVIEVNDVPMVNLVYPPNNYHTNLVDETFKFNYNDVEATSGDCTLYISGTSYGTANGVADGTVNQTISNSPSLGEGSYTYYINCTDGTDVGKSEVWTFVVDVTYPVWTVHSPLLSNGTNFQNYLDVDMSVFDTNLFRAYLYINHTNGSNYHANYSGDLDQTLYNMTYTINSSSWPDGIYNGEISATDDHTFGDISDISYDQIGTTLNIYDKGIREFGLVIVESEYELDKIYADERNSEIKFMYEFKGKVKVKFKIDNPSTILRDEKYGHFVIGDKYLDFREEVQKGAELSISKIGEYYEVEIEMEGNILDPVVGGLNVKTHYFYINKITTNLTNYSISPGLPNTTDTLICSFNVTSAFETNVSIQWYRNDTLWTEDTQAWLDITKSTQIYTNDSGNIEPADTITAEYWKCEITVADNETYERWNTSSVYILGVPNITEWVPVNLTPAYEENVTVIFNMTNVTEEGVTNWWWWLDGVFKVATRAWSWAIPWTASTQESNITYNVTGAVNDTSGKWAFKTWMVNVLNLNLDATITDFDQTPSLIWWNETIFLTCNVTDEDDVPKNMTVSMNFRLQNYTVWFNISTVTYNATGNNFNGNFTTEVNRSWLGYYAFRCRVHDGQSWSSWTYDYDTVYVNESNIPPSIPQEITPSAGAYDVEIPFKCKNVTDINYGAIYYDFQVYFENNTEGSPSWKVMIENHTSKDYTFNVMNIPIQTGINAKCRANDGTNYSSWFNQTLTNLSVVPYRGVILRQVVPKFTYSVARGEKMVASIGCEFYNNDSIYVDRSYVDCNEDDIWDYVFDYENKSLQRTENLFTCIRTIPGNYPVKGGCVVKKWNETWGSDICAGLSTNHNYCDVTRKYNIQIVA